MRGHVEFLNQQENQNAELAATLTGPELPNLLALLDVVQRAGNAEATIALTTSLYSLLQWAGKPRLLARVGQVRDAAAAALGDAWNHARFETDWTRIQHIAAGSRDRALADAPELDYMMATEILFLIETLEKRG